MTVEAIRNGLTGLGGKALANSPAIYLETGRGRSRISLVLVDTGEGLHGILSGGERPHVGGVVLVVPRPSLSGQGLGVDSYITPLPGHKDIEVALPLAEKLARAQNQPVVISAGIHVDQPLEGELAEIAESCVLLAERALEVLQRH